MFPSNRDAYAIFASIFLMGFNLVTELPIWFSVLCIAAGIFYAWLLYRGKQQNDQFSPAAKRILFVLRSALVAILAFLLLGPMLRTYQRQVEKPVIILALDASSSLINSSDSSGVRMEITGALDQLRENLSKEYDVRTYSFGDHTREGFETTFSDKATNFTDLYNTLDVNYANRNVGAILIASDGLYNQGESPVYGPSRVKVPVYTMALGDTTIRKDLAITRINSNRMAFLGNSFPLEIILDAKQCAGEAVTLQIQEDSVPVFSKSIMITGNNFHSGIPVFLEAKNKGIRHYRVSVNVLNGEVTAVNNVRDLYIEIAENRQKILILANAPHPDLAALKSAIEVSPNYEVTIVPDGKFSGRSANFNLVIFHNLPSVNTAADEFIKQVREGGIASWYILGASVNLTKFNALNSGLTIQAPGTVKINEVQAVTDAGFTLFTFSDNLAREINQWPPLSAPFGVYNVNAAVSSLLFQKIGAVSSRQPLLYFNTSGQGKSAVLTGEGLWRWKLADAGNAVPGELFRELVSKTVQYLVIRENTSPFRIYTSTAFNENEPVQFDAQLFNPGGEPVNNPEVKLVIVNSEGKRFPYTFSRNEKNYSLNAGQFPVGRYNYNAEVKLGSNLFRQSGEFSVNALQLESASTVADHQVLYALSDRSGGRLFFPTQIKAISDSIISREDVKPVTFRQRKLTELINMPWVFFGLMALVSTEWFIRKRSGSY